MADSMLDQVHVSYEISMEVAWTSPIAPNKKKKKKMLQVAPLLS